MNEEDIQIGDLVTAGSEFKRIGLAVGKPTHCALRPGDTESNRYAPLIRRSTVQVYWFRLGYVRTEWQVYLRKLAQEE